MIFGTAHVVCGAGCVKQYGVRPSLQPALAGLLLCDRWAEMSISCCNSCILQVNVGSATLSAYIGS